MDRQTQKERERIIYTGNTFGAQPLDRTQVDLPKALQTGTWQIQLVMTMGKKYSKEELASCERMVQEKSLVYVKERQAVQFLSCTI